MRMTNKQFTRYQGERCPYCIKKDVEHTTVIVRTVAVNEDTEVTRDAECMNCGYIWSAVYQLTGYQERHYV